MTIVDAINWFLNQWGSISAGSSGYQIPKDIYPGS